MTKQETPMVVGAAGVTTGAFDALVFVQSAHAVR